MTEGYDEKSIDELRAADNTEHPTNGTYHITIRGDVKDADSKADAVVEFMRRIRDGDKTLSLSVTYEVVRKPLHTANLAFWRAYTRQSE